MNLIPKNETMIEGNFNTIAEKVLGGSLIGSVLIVIG